jgi:hypothetical protein
MAWFTSVTTVARFRFPRWRGDRLQAIRFRVRLLRAAVSRMDSLPAGFVMAVELLDRDVDWLREEESGRPVDWAGL